VSDMQEAVLSLPLEPGSLPKGLPPVLCQPEAGSQEDVSDMQQGVLAVSVGPSLLP